jgi:hypothetical protein
VVEAVAKPTATQTAGIRNHLDTLNPPKKSCAQPLPTVVDRTTKERYRRVRVKALAWRGGTCGRDRRSGGVDLTSHSGLVAQLGRGRSFRDCSHAT